MSLDETDHTAIVCVHAFIQNLYFYASHNNEVYRRHMLMDTLLIPRLVLPYLERAVSQASDLTARAVAYADVLDGDSAIAQLALHNPNLVQGIASSLRTLIIASFRAPGVFFSYVILYVNNIKMIKIMRFSYLNLDSLSYPVRCVSS